MSLGSKATIVKSVSFCGLCCRWMQHLEVEKFIAIVVSKITNIFIFVKQILMNVKELFVRMEALVKIKSMALFATVLLVMKETIVKQVS